jgi:hypothetical protein
VGSDSVAVDGEVGASSRCLLVAEGEDSFSQRRKGNQSQNQSYTVKIWSIEMGPGKSGDEMTPPERQVWMLARLVTWTVRSSTSTTQNSWVPAEGDHALAADFCGVVGGGEDLDNQRWGVDFVDVVLHSIPFSAGDVGDIGVPELKVEGGAVGIFGKYHAASADAFDQQVPKALLDFHV